MKKVLDSKVGTIAELKAAYEKESKILADRKKKEGIEDNDEIQDWKEFKEAKEAKKDYKVVDYEYSILPKKAIDELDRQLHEIDLEIAYLRQLRQTAPADKITPKLDPKEIAAFAEKVKTERAVFDKEMNVVKVNPIDPKDKAMLSDIEFAIRNAIKKGKLSDYVTIPELDIYGEEKKEWDKWDLELAKENENDETKKRANEIRKIKEDRQTAHEAQFKRETPVDTMAEYVKVEVKAASIPREYYFTVSFDDSLRRPDNYDDEAEFAKEEKDLPLNGLSLRTYVKRKFFNNVTKDFIDAFEGPSYAKPDEPVMDKPPDDLEEKRKIIKKQKQQKFSQHQCASRLEDYVFKGPFFQYVKDFSFAECDPIGYDWMIQDCRQTIDFVPHVLKSEMIIYLACGNDEAREYWKSRGRKFYHYVKDYMDCVISGLKRYRGNPDMKEFMKFWLKGFILLVQYTLFGYTETYDLFERVLKEEILKEEQLYERALIDVFLASWGLVEFLRDPLQDKFNQLSSQTSSFEYERLKLPKSEPGKGILVRPPHSYWQDYVNGKLNWEKFQVELGHILNIIFGYKPQPINNKTKYASPDGKELFLVSTNWKRLITARKKRDDEVQSDGKEKTEDLDKTEEERKADEESKLEEEKEKKAAAEKAGKDKKAYEQWQTLVRSSPIFEATDATDGGEIDMKTLGTVDIKTTLTENSPLLDPHQVFTFFQAKRKRDIYDPTVKYLSTELLTDENFNKDLSSTERAQKVLKFITQFEDTLNILHTDLSMDLHRDEIFDWIMTDWRQVVTEKEWDSAPLPKVNSNLQRALIDCIVDLSIFPEGRKFFQNMLRLLSKQVNKEAESAKAAEKTA